MFCMLGGKRSLLMQLCSLPAPYYLNSALMDILMPTLMAICYKNQMAVDLISPSLSSKTFARYLEVSTLYIYRCMKMSLGAFFSLFYIEVFLIDNLKFWFAAAFLFPLPSTNHHFGFK
ncbi:unnamed protein product [Gongylonema pulchrum]|uniref:Ovule protein n=1 Tax=Gongylonema pulchrum TaxID=637853 RepID=A0A183DC18_9BILA|nr:unnamed protein product [Gongylonema pulchrum]